MSVPLPSDFLRIPVAHRALHDVTQGRPENSRAAIRAAMAKGYAIEIDIQPSADDAPMVFHDYDVSRLACAEGLIKERLASDLNATKLRGGDEGIPSLHEVLTMVAGRVPLLIEIKDQDGSMGPSVGALEARVAADLVGYAGPVAVMSFNPHSVMAMADYAPHVARGLVTSSFDPDQWGLPRDLCDRLRGIPDYEAAGCSFVSHQMDDLARPRVAELKASGAGILCWTVKSPEQEAEARKIAQNITFEQYLAALPA